MSGKFEFRRMAASLEDVLGAGYIDAVVGARTALAGEQPEALYRLVREKVDFLPESMLARLHELLSSAGGEVSPPLARSPDGAGTREFARATRTQLAPLSGYGYFRVGEDGRLYAVTKSEHYHAPMGHSFPGYRLVEHARRLGIPNATHNNTRGFITRRLEDELVSAAGRACCGGASAAGAGTLDTVMNLETGSLAVEASLKMILARFYKPQEDSPEPPYAGRIPVILVVGADDGGLQANYHGTTLLTQTFRGMWGGIRGKIEDAEVCKVVPVRPNAIEDVRKAFERYECGKTKIAGFFHEIIMMNYGARVLAKEFLQETYRLCERHDVATVDDEIQSCMWHHDYFMFGEWGIKPAFLAVGKGFPGGEYAASRLLFDGRYDVLPQFGALVTNGQEELASLAYLVTMAWAKANRDVTRALGDYYEASLMELAERHESLGCEVRGMRHLCGMEFREVEPATEVARTMTEAGFDISVQSYKAACPPVALTKLPLIADKPLIDAFVRKMDTALASVSRGPTA